MIYMYSPLIGPQQAKIQTLYIVPASSFDKAFQVMPVYYYGFVIAIYLYMEF